MRSPEQVRSGGRAIRLAETHQLFELAQRVIDHGPQRVWCGQQGVPPHRARLGMRYHAAFVREDGWSIAVSVGQGVRLIDKQAAEEVRKLYEGHWICGVTPCGLILDFRPRIEGERDVLQEPTNPCPRCEAYLAWRVAEALVEAAW